MTREMATTEQNVPLGLAERYQEALTLWLRWNDAQEHIDANLFAARHDIQQATELLDQLDRLRQRAVKLSSQLLDLTAE